MKRLSSAEAQSISVEYFLREGDEESQKIMVNAIKAHDPRSKGGDNLNFVFNQSEQLFGYLHDVKLIGPPVDDTDGTTVPLTVQKGDFPPFQIAFPMNYLKQGNMPHPVGKYLLDCVRKIYGVFKRK